MYINKTIKCEILDELSDEKFEVIWVKLRPYRLPRGMSCIVVANVYHPQTEYGASDAEILSFLYESMSSIEARFPRCGILIAGDFNRLDTSGFQNAFQLKQIVKFPTRGNRTLDPIFTNMKSFYKDPINFPAFQTTSQ